MGLMRRSLRPPGGRLSSWGKVAEFGDGLRCVDSNGKWQTGQRSSGCLNFSVSAGSLNFKASTVCHVLWRG
jgi:hypothetical protein